MFMDCNYWSCFVHEDERLLIGGLVDLQFETIRNIRQSENYSQYIKALNILGEMVKGYRLGNIKPHRRDVAVLEQIIKFEANGNGSGIPKYIQTFIHHFVSKITQIMINYGDWRHHEIDMPGWGFDFYGFKKVSHLFTGNDGRSMIDFSLFMKLLPNAKVFCIGDFDEASAANVNTFMNLSSNFTVKIMECIDILNKSSLSLSCSRFEIIKPSTSIYQYIQNNKKIFGNKGWKLKSDKFHGRYGFRMKLPEEMLVIEKITD